eukprot:365009-Chlamydomonas_euryale.AAC.3
MASLACGWMASLGCGWAAGLGCAWEARLGPGATASRNHLDPHLFPTSIGLQGLAPVPILTPAAPAVAVALAAAART